MLDWENFGNDEQQEYSLVPAGKYKATLDNVEYYQSKTGTEGFTTEVTIVEGKFKNRKIWKTFWVTDGTFSKFLPWQTHALGISTELKEVKPKDFEAFAKTCVDLLGHKIGNLYLVEVTEVEAQNGYNAKNENIFLEHEAELIEDTPTSLPNHAPTFDSDEELPF